MDALHCHQLAYMDWEALLIPPNSTLVTLVWLALPEQLGVAWPWPAGMHRYSCHGCITSEALSTA